MDNLNTRPATASDIEICYRIKQQALKPYVNIIWGWDERQQRQLHRASFTTKDTSIICRNTKAIGYYELEDADNEFFLKNLLIQKSFQNLGIGSFVLKQVIRQAEALQKPIRLRVFKINTEAQKFYREHGFEVFETMPHHLKMLRELHEEA